MFWWCVVSLKGRYRRWSWGCGRFQKTQYRSCWERYCLRVLQGGVDRRWGWETNSFSFMIHYLVWVCFLASVAQYQSLYLYIVLKSCVTFELDFNSFVVTIPSPAPTPPPIFCFAYPHRLSILLVYYHTNLSNNAGINTMCGQLMGINGCTAWCSYCIGNQSYTFTGAYNTVPQSHQALMSFVQVWLISAIDCSRHAICGK